MEIKDILYINLHLKKDFGMDARASDDTVYCMWRISLLCGPGIVNDVTKVGHAQNIYYQGIVL